ncbi:MAG: cell division topological specificity factor MinE [Alphaproteobacteria bacterium]
MNLFGSLLRRRSASVANERLKILLTHERQLSSQTDLIPVLQGEIVKVVAKHVSIDRDKVQVSLDRGEIASMLEINIEVPTASTFEKKNVRRQARAS